MKRALILSAVIFMTLVAGIAWSAILNVPSPAYPNIQPAVSASSPGDTVVVANGTYTGAGNKDIDFGGKAITVRSANGPVNCIIDCEGSGRGFYFHSGEGSNSIVQGFTIRGGFVDDIGGGGICCWGSSPTITDCIISGNSAVGSGGGIWCDSSSPTIRNCTISDNNASRIGGGIYCNFVADLTITNCIISGNNAGWVGGGMDLYKSSATITNCTISDNNAGWDGGGIYCGWVYLTITNCTISDNSASNGGGIYCYSLSYPTITNCILWNDTPNEIITDPDFGIYKPIVQYSDVQGGWVGVGNINLDPKFVSPPNYHLQNISPCINTGTTAGAPPLDKDGNPRVGNPDMGAYEYQGIKLNLSAIEYRFGAPKPGYSYAKPFFKSWMEVKIKNNGPGDAFNVTAKLNGNKPANVAIVDGNVSLGNIPAGGNAWSIDTFTIIVDMSKPQNPAESIHWDIEYDDANGYHNIIENVPQFP